MAGRVPRPHHLEEVLVLIAIDRKCLESDAAGGPHGRHVRRRLQRCAGAAPGDTLRSIVHKVRQVLFLTIGLIIIRHPMLMPMMMVLSMITGDFLAMSATTDNVEPSPQPTSGGSTV